MTKKGRAKVACPAASLMSDRLFYGKAFVTRGSIVDIDLHLIITHGPAVGLADVEFVYCRTLGRDSLRGLGNRNRFMAISKVHTALSVASPLPWVSMVA